MFRSPTNEFVGFGFKKLIAHHFNGGLLNWSLILSQAFDLLIVPHLRDKIHAVLMVLLAKLASFTHE